MAQYQGIDMRMVGLDEAKEMYPFLETHDLSAILYDPYDGDIDPAQLTQAMAKGARDLGATIVRFCPATGVRRENGEWIVETEKGEIRCEYVVNAAGYYAQRVGEWFKPHGGRTVPMVVMSHQYFLTEEIPAVAEWTKANGKKLPLIRDVDSSYYLRQDKNGLNLGPYERNCKAHWVTPEDPMPHDFSFQLYPDDLDRLEWYIEDAMARVPVLGEGGVGRNINGPIPYAPDGLPMIGPMPGVEERVRGRIPSPSGSCRRVVRARCWPNGSPKARPSGTCGPAIRVATPITPIPSIVWTKRWRLTATNTGCISHGRRGLRGGIGSCRRSMQRCGNWVARWVPMAVGNGRTGLRSRATTPRWRPPRRGNGAGPWEPRVRAECEAVRDGVGVLGPAGFLALQPEWRRCGGVVAWAHRGRACRRWVG